MGRNKHDPVWKSGGGGGGSSSFIHSSHWHVWNKKKSITVSFHFNKRRRYPTIVRERARNAPPPLPPIHKFALALHLHTYWIYLVSEAAKEKSLTLISHSVVYLFSGGGDGAHLWPNGRIVCVAFTHTMHLESVQVRRGYLNFRKCLCYRLMHFVPRALGAFCAARCIWREITTACNNGTPISQPINQFHRISRQHSAVCLMSRTLL